MESSYIVVIGSMNCDMIFLQDRLPAVGETYLAERVSVASGGKGANQAVQAAKLGIKTYLVAKVGRDSFGEFLCGEVAGYGVDTSYILRGSGTTGMAAVNALSSGLYHSTVAPGTNQELTIDEIRELEPLIARASIVVLQLEIPVEIVREAVSLAHAHGVYVVLNAAPACALDDHCLGMVDCLVVNESEASFYLGEEIDSLDSAMGNYRTLLSRVKHTLIITLGANGSLLTNGDGAFFFPTDKSIKAVETTGSGDSYVGAFAYMKANGASDETACAFASLASQRTVMSVGAQPAMPVYQDICNWEKMRDANQPMQKLQ